jgi:hypothetical protein
MSAAAAATMSWPNGRAVQLTPPLCRLAPAAHRIMCWECSSVALGAFNTAWHQCEPLHAEVALQPHVCWDTQRLRMGMLLSTLSRTSKQASVQESPHAIPSSRTARALPMAGPKNACPTRQLHANPHNMGFSYAWSASMHCIRLTL